MKKMFETHKSRRFSDYIFVILIAIFLICLIGFGIQAPRSQRGFQTENSQKMTQTFTVRWGGNQLETTLPATINNPSNETIYLSTALPDFSKSMYTSILLRCRQARVKIYLDGTLIGDSGEQPTQPYPLGYGSSWQSVRIPSDADGQTLTIEIHPAYHMPAVSGYLPAVYCGTQTSFIYMILRSQMPVVCTCLILIAIGLYYMFNGLFIIHRKKSKQLFFLGAFAADTGLWMLMETHVLELFTSNIAVLNYMNYMTYALMPILVLRALLSYEQFESNRYLCLSYLVGIILNITLMFLAITGVCSQFESQIANRVYLIIASLGLLLALFSVRKQNERSQRRTIYYGVSILVISTILELIYFFLITPGKSGIFLRLGLFLFILYLGANVMREGKALRKDDFEKEVLSAMAYTDGLTKLSNRFAYELEKNRLEQFQDIPVTIMVCDLNGLKQLNDNLGHTWGDQAICETARLLDQAFSPIAKCYRIGGDEFCVLSEHAEPDSFEECRQTFIRSVTDYDHPICQFGVASGVATGTSSDIDEVFREADQLMYQCKKAMKNGEK